MSLLALLLRPLRRPVRGGGWISRHTLRRTWSIAVLAGACAAVLTVVAPRAAAQDRWTTPHPGIRHLYRRASGPREIHALVVNLCQAGISFRATKEDERRRTVPTWASNAGVEAAVNGDFFSFDTYRPSGAAVGNGAPWSRDNNAHGFVAFGRDRVELSRDATVVAPLPSWMAQVVGGKPTILRAGEIVDHGTRELCTLRHPRTAVGISRDRQTLYVMVVDGRSSRSIGMTCAEEARFLRSLGAWDALNLDGGGSSTMWIRGTGTVNRPSDGTPRVVSNHLGIHSNGSGIPSSCMPYAPEEDSALAGALATTTSDLNGDGRADVCGRGYGGIRCHLAEGTAFGDALTGPALSDESGWSDATNYETIVMGDVTGDGLADVCARANARMFCWPSTGTGFGARIDGPTLADESGWDAPQHYGTIRLGDVDGDGTDDVCARAAAGLSCWTSTGSGFLDPWAPIAAMSNDAGFGDPSKWSTIRLGDVDGDGLADACARGAQGFDCWRSTGAGFESAPIAGPRWSDESGWTGHPHYSTLRLADLDGDGRADVCAKAGAGLHCHLSTGTGFGDAITIDALANDAGWSDMSNYSTIALADIDGDRDRDVCARADSGVVCWPFEGDRFGARITGPALSDTSGWSRAYYYRTLRFGDVDGDGDDDLCARAAAGVRCWPAQGGTFGEAIVGPEWSDDSGWWPVRFHSTLRLAGPRRAPVVVDPMTGADAGVSRGDASVPPSMPGRDAGARPPEPADPTAPAAMSGGCAVAPHGEARVAALWACIASVAVVAARRRRRRR